MEDWNDYRLILALHRAKTLRGAAMILATTHTTVARHLAQLHKRRHGIVFEKVAGGYRATSLGQELVLVAQRIEQVVLASDRIDRAQGDDLAGPIMLSLAEPMAQYLLLDDLVRFCKTYPDIQLTINCSTNIVDLDKSEADVAIRSAKALPEHLVGRRLFSYALSYYAQIDYFNNTPPQELSWISPSDDTIWPAWLAESPYPEAPINLIITDIVTRFKALESGYGLSRAACFMADPNPKLMRLKGAQVVTQPDIWILTHPDLRHSPRVKLLMQYLVDALNAKQSLLQGKSY